MKKLTKEEIREFGSLADHHILAHMAEYIDWFEEQDTGETPHLGLVVIFLIAEVERMKLEIDKLKTMNEYNNIMEDIKKPH